MTAYFIIKSYTLLSFHMIPLEFYVLDSVERKVFVSIVIQGS